MSLLSKAQPPRQQSAHDATLHLLAWPKQYPLTEASELT
jgi:hypothetical protein